jgi:inhibitor of KinA
MASGSAGIRMLCAGEQGLVVEFANVISPQVNARVQRLASKISQSKVEGVIELVPTYRSLLVYFDPLQIARSDLARMIERLLAVEEEVDEGGREKVRLIRVPVCYGGEFGPDLDDVARHKGLAVDDVIAIHSSRPYLVYMLGFTPGFAYLGGMSPKLAIPRLERPRTKIAAGSVGIADNQTGLYPIESPGGWRLIGRTPLQPFSPGSARPFLFAAGDYLQFVPVSAEEFVAIRRQVQAGSYSPHITEELPEPISHDRDDEAGVVHPYSG